MEENSIVDEMDKHLIADNFFEIRKNKQQNISELSKTLGLTVQDIDLIEISATKIINDHAFNTLANYYQGCFQYNKEKEMAFYDKLYNTSMLDLSENDIKDILFLYRFMQGASIN